jgi:cytochrome c oxidase cbb3-type subunit 2
MAFSHPILEKNVVLLAVATLITVAIGGLVQIVPLFTIEQTIERVEGVRPYSPLELAGRNIYVREGCYVCHSQQVRPFRDEIERYGHYSLAAESMYDKPFQWGSKRTGPDLARVGGKFSDEWQLRHLNDPRSVSPQSIMPAYPWLAKTELNFADIATELKVNRLSGVPYTDEMIANAAVDLRAQIDPEHPGAAALEKRYPKAQIRPFVGDPRKVTEADALIAYLQVLGTLVDLKLYDNKANLR